MLCWRSKQSGKRLMFQFEASFVFLLVVVLLSLCARLFFANFFPRAVSSSPFYLCSVPSPPPRKSRTGTKKKNPTQRLSFLLKSVDMRKLGRKLPMPRAGRCFNGDLSCLSLSISSPAPALLIVLFNIYTDPCRSLIREARKRTCRPTVVEGSN